MSLPVTCLYDRLYSCSVIISYSAYVTACDLEMPSLSFIQNRSKLDYFRFPLHA